MNRNSFLSQSTFTKDVALELGDFKVIILSVSLRFEFIRSKDC